MKCLLEYPGKLSGILHKIAMLDKGLTGSGYICLLENITAENIALDLSCNAYKRDGIHICSRNSCYHIKGAGAGGGNAYSHR